MDYRILHGLNSWFSANAFRSDLAKGLATVPLLVLIGLVVVAWLADWGREPDRRALLVVGAMGALLALAINVAIGHFYYRPRPYVVLPVPSLLPQHPDSSFFSDHMAVAGALTVALFLARRWVGGIAVALSVVVAVGRVAAAVHYPSDVVAGFAVGAASFAVLLPARQPVARLVAIMSEAEAGVVRRERRESNFLLRHGPLAAAGALVLAIGLGYGIRFLTDHGPLVAAQRQQAALRQLEQAHAAASPRVVPATYPGTTVAAIAGGHYETTHAAVQGAVTQVTRELDGDIHIRIENQGDFIVAEIMPELPISPPHVGENIGAWGIVRHDGLHNWWELHPLVGWRAGNAVNPGAPGIGVGD